eukprot:scaffold3156_cov268-Chaetoceros_neogracile.AAC.39
MKTIDLRVLPSLLFMFLCSDRGGSEACKGYLKSSLSLCRALRSALGNLQVASASSNRKRQASMLLLQAASKQQIIDHRSNDDRQLASYNISQQLLLKDFAFFRTLQVARAYGLQ